VPAPIPIRYPKPTLADGAVSLRPWRDADVARMVEICRDPDAARFTRVPEPYGEADAREWLAGQAGRLRAGAGLALAIHERHDTGPVGTVGLDPDPNDRDVAELGYIVAPWARGRGVATAAVRLLAAWSLQEWRPGRLQLTTHVDNLASQRVAERSGFRREGVMRSWAEIKGRRVDLVMYSRLPGDP
jgi:RimJ/RimL family protein N-acetyltransferase